MNWSSPTQSRAAAGERFGCGLWPVHRGDAAASQSDGRCGAEDPAPGTRQGLNPGTPGIIELNPSQPLEGMIPFRDSAKGTPMDQKIFAALAHAVAVAGCMPDSPRTALDWGVDATGPQHVASKGPAKTYVYEEKAVRPTPRPSPNYVARNVPPYSPVTSPAPVS